MDTKPGVLRSGWACFRSWPRWAQAMVVVVAATVALVAITDDTQSDTPDVITAPAGSSTTSPTAETSPTPEEDPPATSSDEAFTAGGARTEPGTGPATDEPPSEVIASDRDTLDALRVEPEGSRSGYDRDLFSHWDDDNRDGCDTRCEVLAASRLSDGGWFSQWDGATEYDPSLVHIDHIVALAEAWDSGASAWSRADRDAFADDRTNLIAVTAASNLRKSDKDAAEWFPSRADANCFWARSTVTVKSKWDLSVDVAEHKALYNLLGTCDPQGSAGAPAPARPAAPATSAPTTAAPPPPQPSSGSCPNGGSYTTADGSCIDDHDTDGNGDVNCGEVASSAKPVQVRGDDPHGLDRDGDGVGCEG